MLNRDLTLFKDLAPFNFEFDQDICIKNCNVILQLLQDAGFKVKLLDEDGVCSGLSKKFILEAQTQNLTGFYLNLICVVQLKIDKIPSIVKQYLEHLKLKKKFWLKVGNFEIDFDKLIDFIQAISDAQISQNQKTILAGWDRNFTFICEKDELANALTSADIASGKLMTFSMYTHEFSLLKLDIGYHLFEPDRIEIPPKLLANEEEIAKKILENITSCGFFEGATNKVAFSISFLSFGNQTRCVDDAIANVGVNNRVKFPKLESLITSYQIGRLSRLDFALAVCAEIETYELGDNIDPELQQFNRSMISFIENFQMLDHDFGLSFQYINDTAFDDNITLLLLVIQSNQIYFFFKLLLEKKINLQSCSFINKILSTVVTYGCDEILRELLNYPEFSQHSDQILDDAIELDQLSIVKLLFPLKPNSTLLHESMNKAFYHEAPKVLRYFIELGAKPDVLDRDQFCLLHHAVAKKLHVMVDALLESGANPNIPDGNGITPLVLAAKANDVRSAKKLIVHGGDPTIIGCDNISPFGIALIFNHKHIIDACLTLVTSPIKQGEMTLMQNCFLVFNYGLKRLQVASNNLFHQASDYRDFFFQAAQTDETFFNLLAIGCLIGRYPLENTLKEHECRKLIFEVFLKIHTSPELIKECKNYVQRKNLRLTSTEQESFKSEDIGIKDFGKNLYLARFNKTT